MRNAWTILTAVVFCFCLALVLCGCERAVDQASTASSQKKISLFNGKDFSGWEMFFPDENVDPATVWSVKDGVIHCVGQPIGYIRTNEEYHNYKLHVEWRWVDKAGNSGVLLHTTAPDKVWPKSIEAQLMSGDAGDFWLIDGTGITGNYGTGNRRQEKMKPSSEKPLGQWNRYDIVCRADTIELFVNDVLQNKASGATVNAGKICLQSEGAPIEFRNIYIKPLH